MHRAARLVTPKPLLASEVLRDELAPFEPARRACLLWFAGIALALVLLGLALRLGVGMPSTRLDAATIAFSAAGAVVAVAILPFPYALRAAVVALVGAVLMVLGLRAAGPLAGLGIDGGLPRDIARLLAVTALPAALLFRAHYRAYGRARVVLAVALAAAMPFVAAEVLLVIDSSAAPVMRAAAAVNVGAVLCSLLGFMGEGTTGAGSVWAALVLVALPAELALRQLTPLASAETGFLTYPAAGVGTACGALLVSLGLFQLLAAALFRDARRLAKKPPGFSDTELERTRTLG